MEFLLAPYWYTQVSVCSVLCTQLLAPVLPVYTAVSAECAAA
jgi:hypothetical protein